VGIASNLDQVLNMDYIERIGAGALVRADRARVTTVRDATRWAVDDPQARERARAMALLGTTTRAEAQFPAAIRLLLDAAPWTVAKLTM